MVRNRIASSLIQPFLILVVAFAGAWLLFQILGLGLRHAPEPIGSRAELFVEGGTRTLLLTIYAGVFGLFLGMVAALV